MQLSFSDLPTGHDFALAVEVLKETGKRSLPDNHPILLDYLHSYLDNWLATRPDSNIHEIRANYDFFNF